MHLLGLNITDLQKEKLDKIKEETGIPVSVQIRKVIDQYLEK